MGAGVTGELRAAAAAWHAAAHGIAIPPRILDAAPASPWSFATATFAARADEALGDRPDTPSDRMAREALRRAEPGRASVLDVGSGAGAACLRLLRAAPGADDEAGGAVASSVVAVDGQADMLVALAERAVPRCADVTLVTGRWPDVADRVGRHDVVVCHHVLHNTDDPASFVRALVAAARVAVVVELTDAHPLDWLRPYWLQLHGWDAPAGTSADLLDDVLAAMDDVAVVDRVTWDRPFGALGGGLPSLRRRLCLPEDRDAELAALLDVHPPPTTQPIESWTLASRAS